VPVREGDLAPARAFMVQPRTPGAGNPGPPELLYALWEDGLFIWQATRADGTPLLLSRVLAREEADRAISELAASIRSVSCANREHTAADAGYRLVAVSDVAGVIGLASLHPMYENSPGVAVINGRVYVRSSIGSDIRVSAEWRQFLKSWSESTDTFGEFARPELGVAFMQKVQYAQAP
jgi:hypothetical protein